MASLEAFLLRSTQSKQNRSHRATILYSTPLPSPAHFSALIPLANSWISLAVFVDVSITYVRTLLSESICPYAHFSASLFYFLRRSKTGFKSGSIPVIHQATV